MSKSVTYVFDEIFPFTAGGKTLDVCISGEAEVSYSGDTDAADWRVSEIYLNSHEFVDGKVKRDRHVIDTDHPLYSVIEDHIENDSDGIYELISKDEDDGYDAWMSDAYDRDRDDRITGDL